MAACVEKLPAQQQSVFKATMDVVAALRSDAPSSVLQGLLSTLREHLETSFDAEDATMAECELPDLEAHQLAHGWLRTVLLELCAAANQIADTQEARDRFADRFQRDFSAPMISHAQTFDRKMRVLLGKIAVS